ncbi:MAG: DUF2303 family protein [Ferruginibacter sp.]
MKDLNIKIENTGSTLTVLEGKTLDPKAPEKIAIVGNIKTVGNFLKVRIESGEGLQTIDKSKAVILVDKKELEIKLLLDPENHYGASVTGTLQVSDELKNFSINQNKTFTKEELVKLIKFNKIYFDDATKHAEMLLAFQKLNSTVNIKANESSDDRGNKERQFVKEVTTNAPTEFILNIPVFKGFEPLRFRVEVALDVTEGSARFWFESIELHEIMMRKVDEIFNDELKAAEGFVVINK